SCRQSPWAAPRRLPPRSRTGAGRAGPESSPSAAHAPVQGYPAGLRPLSSRGGLPGCKGSSCRKRMETREEVVMPIPTLTFGRTGHESTRVLFGGAAVGSVTQDTADRTLEVLLSYGVNHLDVAASYGYAELRI